MRKGWLAGAALLAGSWIAAAATEKKPDAGPQVGEQPAAETEQGLSFGANQINGRVQAFDPNQKKITLNQDGRPQELKITDETTVFIEGRLGTAADLKEGAPVRAAYETRDGSKSLRWIEVKPATAAASSANTNEPAKPFFGHISAIDRGAKQVSITHGDDTRVFDVADNTKILGLGKEGTLNDLKEGQEVRATATKTEQPKDHATASDIEVLSSPTPAKPAAPKPPKAQPPETTY